MAIFSTPACSHRINPMPHRRIKELLVTFFCLASLASGLLLLTSPAMAYDDQELAFLSLVNNYRQQSGLLPLTLSASLSNSALGHSQDMAINNFFSHAGSNGSSPWDRMRAAGYTYNTWLGENIAAGYGSAQSVFDAWRNSPEHNANILNPNYRAIGIGRYYNAASSYGWYWTTDFGGVPEAPFITIPAPTGAPMASGLVIFRANAFDYAGITRVDLFIDGKQVASRVSPPFSYYWNTKAFANGNHTLSATAYNIYGQSSQASIIIQADNFMPARRYYFTWYDQLSPGLKTWVLMANPATGESAARAAALVGPVTCADRVIGVAAPAQTQSFPGVMGGPVTIATMQPLIASERSIYNDSFNETAAVPGTSLSSANYFTWYDSTPQDGMTGDWILIGNMGAAAANVQVYIAGALKGTYALPPGGRVTPVYPGTIGGPVKVVSTNGQPLIVSQRVIYRSAFTETAGTAEGSLTTSYFFPWYDLTSDMAGDWILIGNQNSAAASVDIFIAGRKMGSYTVPSGGRITPSYPGVTGGPVRVICTNGKKIIVSQRALFGGSFEEVPGLTAANAGADLWITWYDSTAADGMKGNWILVTNGGGRAANVAVFVGGALKQQVWIPAGDNLPLSYPQTIGGPVRVVSTNGQPLYVTQRVIYKNSFNEIAGIKLN